MLYIIFMHIAHFLFLLLLLMTLLAAYFIFPLDCRNHIRQKGSLNDFLIEFKMGPQATKSTCNINNAFGSETAKEYSVQ